MADELLNVKEMAEYLGMHEVTIREKCRDGVLPAFKIGRAWRIKRSDLNKWIDEQQEN